MHIYSALTHQDHYFFKLNKLNWTFIYDEITRLLELLVKCYFT